MTAAEAAAELGYNDSRVRQLARDKMIRAVKVGRDWLFTPAALDEYRTWREEQATAKQGKRGRPYKALRSRPDARPPEEA